LNPAASICHILKKRFILLQKRLNFLSTFSG